jgi:phage tail sheath protein FI/uncharacterized protein YjdB
MQSFTYPGVYIEEVPSGVHTITGVATSIAAFIGWAPQGPVTEATLVQSWSDYASQFGGLDSRSRLGYAVNQFFGNGGQQCYIVRLVWDGSLPPASGNPAVAATALATGIGIAAAQISASVGSISGSANLYVGPAVLQSITVGPANLPPLPLGASLTLSAVGNFSDGSTAPPPGLNWVSDNPAVVSVTSAGVATAVVLGSATLTATSGLISASMTLSTTAAALSSIAVAPSSPQLAVGQTLQFAATANYTDGTSLDVTAIATWSSSNPGAGTFTATATHPLSAGQLYAVSASTTATVTAMVPWTFPAGTTPTPVTASPATSLVVTAAVVTALTVVPTSPTVPLPGSLTAGQIELAGFSALAAHSDNTTSSPAGVTWTSSNPAVATINASTGAITVVGVGSTTIGASFTDTSITPPYTVVGATTLTVTAARLTTLSVVPNVLSVAGGVSQQLSATGVFSDGTSADLTGSAAWISSDLFATVTPNGGLVTGAAGIATAETATITAQYLGMTATAGATINPPILQSLAVSPATTSVLTGQTRQFTASGTMSDGSSWSGTPSWSSGAPGIASVNAQGVATGLAAGGSLSLFASSPGAWGNALRVSVTVQPPPNSSRFNVLVQQLGTSGQLTTLESFVNLAVAASDPQYAVTVIDNDSNYITFIDPATGQPVVPTAPPATTAAPIALSGGADGAVLVPATDQNFELALLSNPTGGVYLLDRVDIFNLLCIPGETDAPTISTLQEYCNQKRAFFIVDAPQLSTTSGLINSGPVGSTPGSITTGTPASNSAFYFPWILAPDPLFGNRPTLFPPCGFVAGIYAATDASRGVWKAPAGIDAGLVGESGLQYNLTDLENGSLNIQAINCLRQFKVYGDLVWGARTLAGNDQTGSEWKYIPIRRLALYLESSLYDGTQWVVFEPNDETLWGQVRLNVGSFMQGLFLQGAFAGTTPQQAYFVKCDGENNPPASVAQGIVNILVGFAPLYPAEFVVIQIQQIAQSS